MGDAEQPVRRMKLCQKVTADEVLRVIPVLVVGLAPLAGLRGAVGLMVPVVVQAAAMEVLQAVALAAVEKVNDFS
jgi:hypothetical protein